MKKVKVKGALRTYMFSLLYVAILLLIVAVFVALKDLYFGLLIACIAVLCAVLYAVHSVIAVIRMLIEDVSDCNRKKLSPGCLVSVFQPSVISRFTDIQNFAHALDGMRFS